MSYKDNRETDSRRSSNDGSFGGFRVYVGDLGDRTGKTDLEKEFGQYGPVKEVWMGRKREETSPNYAFVVYRYPEDAEEAVRDRNGRKVCGHRVRVEHAKPLNRNPRRGGFRGGFDNRGRGSRGGDFRGNQRRGSRERYNNNRRSRSESPARTSRDQLSPSDSADAFNDSAARKRPKRSPSDSPEPNTKKSKKFRNEASTSPSPTRLKPQANVSDSDSRSSPPPKAKKLPKRGQSSQQYSEDSDDKHQHFQVSGRKSVKSKKKSNYDDYSSDEN